MKKNNSVIILVLLLVYVAIFAGHAMSGEFPREALHAVLAVAAAGLGWYAAKQSATEAKSDGKSIIDALTGLHTYGYFVDRIGEERKRADRFGSRVSMILVDIDDFQGLHREFGTHASSELVKQVGEIVKIQVRGVDIVSRYSDSRFGVLLPNTGKVATQEVAERMREAVEQNNFGIKTGTGVITISIGLSTYPDSAEDDVQLIERVESALAAAKAMGSNRVEIFEIKADKRAAT